MTYFKLSIIYQTKSLDIPGFSINNNKTKKRFIMKNFFYELISDDYGNKSSTRFIYVLGHLILFGLVLYLILYDKVNNLNISLISILVGTLNSTKLIQKSQEGKPLK